VSEHRLVKELGRCSYCFCSFDGEMYEHDGLQFCSIECGEAYDDRHEENDGEDDPYGSRDFERAFFSLFRRRETGILKP